MKYKIICVYRRQELGGLSQSLARNHQQTQTARLPICHTSWIVRNATI